jgi:hypothetical protein
MYATVQLLLPKDLTPGMQIDKLFRVFIAAIGKL